LKPAHAHIQPVLLFWFHSQHLHQLGIVHFREIPRHTAPPQILTRKAAAEKALQPVPDFFAGKPAELTAKGDEGTLQFAGPGKAAGAVPVPQQKGGRVFRL